MYIRFNKSQSSSIAFLNGECIEKAALESGLERVEC